MKLKAIFGITLTLLLVGMLTLAFNIQLAKSDWISYETIYIRADGSIDPPDAPIVTVDNITYTVMDNIVGVNLSTAIVVERDNIILDGAGYTLQGTESVEGILLSGISNVTIKNMKIKKFASGIYLDMSNSCNIFNNKIGNNTNYGISLVDSSNNEILNNRIVNNTDYGIRMTREVNDNVSNNIISESIHGISVLFGSTGNYLINNTVTGTSYGIYMAETSPRNTVKSNKIKAETAAIFVGSSSNNVIDHNIVSAPVSIGVYLYNSDQCSVVYNTVLGDMTFGIRLYLSCDYNYFYNNKILGTMWGIRMEYSSNNNTFVGNWVERNRRGVHKTSSNFNTFYYNNFINNTVQVVDDTTTNIWRYNYWYPEPYPEDPYPLPEPWSEHDVGVVSVSLSATEVYAGETVNITVVVENEGKANQSETFNVTAKYGENLIETQTVTNLASGANTTLMFYWDTTYVEAPYNHTISVEAVAVTDELDTTDNLVVDGTVKVKIPGDVNGDDIVDGADLSLIGKAYRSTPGDPNWDSECDINRDGIVDSGDLSIIGKNYRKSI